MAEVVLFHHVQGLTPGVLALADEMRAAGHTVRTPDLFDGRTFDSVSDGMTFLRSSGFGALVDRGTLVVDGLPADLVYAGISFGVMVAQRLTQTRPGARGALFLESCAPVSEFGTWPDGVPVQIHGMDADPEFANGGDLAAARELVEQVDQAELFVYPGDQHLFTDSSLPSYDADATALVRKRALEFLARV